MEDRYQNDVAVQVPHVLLPKKGTDYYKWAVVACDQFTSQPTYWEEAKRIVGKAPSTLELILPEAYLEKPGEAERIKSIKEHMRDYLDKGVLEEKPQGFVLVTRTVGGVTRTGLVMALDLEAYDYSKGSTTLIRATEGTIVSRIPPRLKIREGAPIELPHILVLIDDPERTVIEPLALKKASLTKLYDTDLMLDGGHISGHLVDGEGDIRGVLNSLGVLKDAERFSKQYGERAPMLFAMGDGNHSFATAKANWEKIKATLPENERADHPARYALVEVENVHDDGIVFEPIHRVVFGASGNRAIETILRHLKAQNDCARVELGRLPCAQSGGHAHHAVYHGRGRGRVYRQLPEVAARGRHPAGRAGRGGQGDLRRGGGLYPRRGCGEGTLPQGRRDRLLAARDEEERVFRNGHLRRRAAEKDLLHG